ncbi:MAG: fatty acid desaturase [Calditrichaceae bacterium]|nr:fatty acid desaturase [Calditrichaceae bacterium]HES59944.1 fatty acid desaturase [Caldithrix sp.]
MSTLAKSININTETQQYRKLLIDYQQPDLKRSIWQIINSFIPYLALLAAMYFSLNVSYWLTLILAIPAAGFMVRIFIISHDCGHGSFFKSKPVRDIVGFITGVIAFVPYKHWRHSHAIHHATNANLDRRGFGDVWTLTVNEYLALSFWRRLEYRLYRNPFIMFTVGPLYHFLIAQRFPEKGAKKKERNSVYLTNLSLAGIVILSSIIIGLKAYLIIQLSVLFFASLGGVWLFYVQHQFEDVYWERDESWDFQAAAIQGSSYYKLPVLLQWFSGNIGYHHIHHLNPRIPNYYLKQCHQLLIRYVEIEPITIRKSFNSLKCRLWDEKNEKMVGFGYLKQLAVT